MNLMRYEIDLRSKVYRFIWNIFYCLFFRTSPVFFHGWRRIILRCFGANISKNVHVYPTAKIWSPSNLIMEENSCLGHYVDCYNVAKVSIGKGATVSQYSFLCTATHDYTRKDFPLLASPISIGAYAWVTADVFIGPGVFIGSGAVINARSSVFSDIDSWMIAKGNPAKVYKVREFVKG